MSANRCCCASTRRSTMPWPGGPLTSSAASTPISRCCCDGRSTTRAGCPDKRRLCPSAVGPPPAAADKVVGCRYRVISALPSRPAQPWHVCCVGGQQSRERPGARRQRLDVMFAIELRRRALQCFAIATVLASQPCQLGRQLAPPGVGAAFHGGKDSVEQRLSAIRHDATSARGANADRSAAPYVDAPQTEQTESRPSPVSGQYAHRQPENLHAQLHARRSQHGTDRRCITTDEQPTEAP